MKQASRWLLGIWLVLSSGPVRAITLESDTVRLLLHEETGRMDVYQKSPETLLAEAVMLGTIQLPGSDETIPLTKEGVPDMKVEAGGTDRIRAAFPIRGKTFHLVLLLKHDTLWTAFSTEPVESPEEESPVTIGEETREWLEAPKAFREVTLLPDLVVLGKTEKGDLVVPYQEGSLLNFTRPLTESRDFVLYENSGLTMPFWGKASDVGSVLCITDGLYMRLAYRSDENSMRLFPRFFPDPYERPVRMQIAFLGSGKGYVSLAQRYRSYLREQGDLPSLRDNLAAKPQLIHLLEGVNIKFPIYMLHEQKPDANGVTPPPREHKYQTFEDVLAVLTDMKNQGMERAFAVWWGWGKQGYDRLHPDYLPPNPVLGGTDVFTEMNRQIDRLGYAIGFHDNYTDIYEAAPSFEEGRHCTVGADGRNLKGGFWAGGQCWLLCSTEGLKYAQRNFDEMEPMGPIHGCFIDVLTAAPLFDCFSPEHPHSKWGDQKNKRAMMEEVSRHFGIMGTEHGFSWGADLCDYFEGIGFDPHTREDHFRGLGSSVPLFSAVYHDAVVHYMHQGAPVTPEAPERFLYNLRAGGACYYNITRDRYEDPRFRDYFYRTYQISTNLIKRTWPHPLTFHRFVDPDQTVEECRYGDAIAVVINRGNQPYEGTVDFDWLGSPAAGTKVRLAPRGFLISAPDFAALNGSQWGKVEVEKDSWLMFRSPSQQPFAESEEILMTNFEEDVPVSGDATPQIRKKEVKVPPGWLVR